MAFAQRTAAHAPSSKAASAPGNVWHSIVLRVVAKALPLAKPPLDLPKAAHGTGFAYACCGTAGAPGGAACKGLGCCSIRCRAIGASCHGSIACRTEARGTPARMDALYPSLPTEPSAGKPHSYPQTSLILSAWQACNRFRLINPRWNQGCRPSAARCRQRSMPPVKLLAWRWRPVQPCCSHGC